MFATSDAYKKAIRGAAETHLSGTIVTNDGVEHPLNDSVIVNGSVEIEHQSLNGEELTFGAAILSELKISVKTEESRYIYFDAVITLQCDVTTEAGIETIPMGEWIVADAKRFKNALKLRAFDKMVKLDKRYDLALEGSPFDLMTAFCTTCECEFALTQKEMEQFPNGEEYISINEESGCDTYRDAAAVVAQMCGCFVHSDRYGKITFTAFMTQPCLTLEKGHRYSSEIADYQCQYNEISITGRAGNFTSVNPEFVEGMRLVIDNAPAWDYGLEEVLQIRTDKLRELIESYNGYTPSEFTIPTDPSLDCGDMITLNTDEGSVNSIVTSIIWEYHGMTSLVSSGVNPYLQMRSAATSRQIRQLNQKIDAAKVIYYPFKNTSRVKLKNEYEKIASVVFTSVTDTSIIFQGTFQVDIEIPDIEETQTISVTIPTITQGEKIDIDTAKGTYTYKYDIGEKTVEYPIKCHNRAFATLRVKYHFDNIDQKIYYINDLNTGGHTLSLYYPVNKIAINTTHTFEVWMSLDAGKGTIQEGMFIGAISGQGLAATSQWNGQFEASEFYECIKLGQRSINPVKMLSQEDITTNSYPYNDEYFTEDSLSYTMLGSRKLTVVTTNEEFGGRPDATPIFIVKQQTVRFPFTDNPLTKTVEDVVSLQTEFPATNVEGTADYGKLYELPIKNTGYAKVTKIEVNN